MNVTIPVGEIPLPFGVKLYYFPYVALIVITVVFLARLYLETHSFKSALFELAANIAPLLALYVLLSVPLAINSGLITGTDIDSVTADLFRYVQISNKLVIAAGSCQANIGATPVQNAWAPEAAAKLQLVDRLALPAMSMLGLATTMVIAYVISVIAAMVGMFLYVPRYSPIGAVLLAFAIAYMYAFLAFTVFLQYMPALKDIGSVDIVGSWPVGQKVVVTYPKNATQYCRAVLGENFGGLVVRDGQTVEADLRIFQLGEKCDNVIGGYACSLMLPYWYVSAAAGIFLMFAAALFFAVRQALK